VVRTRVRIGLAVLVLVAIGVALFRFATAPDSAPPSTHALQLLSPVPAVEGEPVLSLLAAGDTGQSPEEGEPSEQLRVARALADSDAGQAADALLLLGDNFYPDGLLWTELVDRVRINLVRPYCHFAVLEGPLSDAVRRSCSSSRSAAAGIPIYAVLGNHDHRSEESPTIQRHAVAWFLSNWHMPKGRAQSIEMAGGVSLVLFDSKPLRDGAAADGLHAALAASRGPWRILVTHYPIASTRDPDYAVSRKQRRYKKRVRDAIEATGASAQLLLAGHDHLLGASVAELPAPVFNAIAGSGSETETYGEWPKHTLFRAEQLGFARVDLVRRNGDTRLVVSLIAVPISDQPGLAARWEIESSGRARQVWPVTSPYTDSR